MICRVTLRMSAERVRPEVPTSGQVDANDHPQWTFCNPRKARARPHEAGAPRRLIRYTRFFHRGRIAWPNQPMPHLPNPNPVRPGPGPEQRLRNLQRRFRAVSARHDRAIKLRRVIKAATAVVAFAVVWGLGSSPWPVTTTLRHIASAPNCDFARLVGLAPARRGEPGYWKHHDRDGDGVACEPWPPRRGTASRPFSLTTAMANSD